DMFHSVAELLRKPPVRDKDDSDHRKTPRQRAGAAPKGAGRRLPLSYLETVKELSSSTGRRCEKRMPAIHSRPPGSRINQERYLVNGGPVGKPQNCHHQVDFHDSA